MSDATRMLGYLRAPSREVDGQRYWWVERNLPAHANPKPPHVHLLPIYDEYVVAYRDRTLVTHPASRPADADGRSVVLQHALVIDGAIAGTWRTTAAAGSLLEVYPLRRLSAAERAAIGAAATRYERFLGTSLRLKVVAPEPGARPRHARLP